MDDANYADGWSEHAVATTTGILRGGRSNGCYVMASTLADEGTETQTGFGFSVGRHPDELDLSVAAGDAAMRATRLLGATQAAEQTGHGRARAVRHRPVPLDHRFDAERGEPRQGAQPVP